MNNFNIIKHILWNGKWDADCSWFTYRGDTVGYVWPWNQKNFEGRWMSVSLMGNFGDFDEYDYALNALFAAAQDAIDEG